MISHGYTNAKVFKKAPGVLIENRFYEAYFIRFSGVFSTASHCTKF
jgi:hypothetical protein